MKRLWNRIRTSRADARNLSELERRVREGDADAIAEVEQWSAQELAANLGARSILPSICLAVISLGFVFAALFTKYSKFVDIDLALQMVLFQYWLVGDRLRSKHSPILAHVQDPNWINYSISPDDSLNEPNIRRLLAMVDDNHPFVLTAGSETILQKRLGWYLRGNETGLFRRSSSGLLAAEILAAYGKDEKSGELLLSAVHPGNAFRPAVEIMSQLRAFCGQFEARQLA